MPFSHLLHGANGDNCDTPPLVICPIECISNTFPDKSPTLFLLSRASNSLASECPVAPYPLYCASDDPGLLYHEYFPLSVNTGFPSKIAITSCQPNQSIRTLVSTTYYINKFHQPVQSGPAKHTFLFAVSST